MPSRPPTPALPRKGGGSQKDGGEITSKRSVGKRPISSFLVARPIERARRRELLFLLGEELEQLVRLFGCGLSGHRVDRQVPVVVDHPVPPEAFRQHAQVLLGAVE